MKRINMNENTYDTSFGTPSTVQFDTMADRTDIILTFEVSGETPSGDEDYSHTTWTEWDAIQNNISTT